MALLKAFPYRRQDLSDPYLQASVATDRKRRCEVCGEHVLCIIINQTELPEHISAEATILYERESNSTRGYVGINCGCYAKFHRQMAYILGNVNRRRREEGKGQLPTL